MSIILQQVLRHKKQLNLLHWWILNVSNFTNGTRNRQSFQHPYRHGDDARLTVSLYITLSKYMPLRSKYYVQWLEEEFLPSHSSPIGPNMPAYQSFEDPNVFPISVASVSSGPWALLRVMLPCITYMMQCITYTMGCLDLGHFAPYMVA